MTLEIRAEDIKEYKNEKIKIKIVWGTSRLQTKTYLFDSERDKDNFMKGVSEALGWLDARVIK
jgi:Holliday junction resolvase RusA-like endonuclease